MILEILRNTKGFRNYWYPDVKEKNVYRNMKLKDKVSVGCNEEMHRLVEKYKQYVPKGWYGFLGLGAPTPLEWFSILEKFTDYLISLQTEGKIQDFEIHQVKIKFGGLRYYVSYSCDDKELREFIDLQIKHMEDTLYDDKLIY